MKSRYLAPLLAIFALVALGAWWNGERDSPPASIPKAAPAPPAPRVPSAATAPVTEPAVVVTREHVAQLVLEIERGLVARDSRQRETAFNFLLPELLSQETEPVVEMVVRQEPGEARDALRNEVARQWITRDREAAIAWITTMENEAERQESAQVAVAALAATSPGEAIRTAEQLGVGRDDGYQAHLAQIWAEDDIDSAIRWIDQRPPGPHTEQLRARIEQVRLSRR